MEGDSNRGCQGESSAAPARLHPCHDLQEASMAYQPRPWVLPPTPSRLGVRSVPSSVIPPAPCTTVSAESHPQPVAQKEPLKENGHFHFCIWCIFKVE